jgi:uncharacterized protein (TIGR03382 family)
MGLGTIAASFAFVIFLEMFFVNRAAVHEQAATMTSTGGTAAIIGIVLLGLGYLLSRRRGARDERYDAEPVRRV